MTSKRNKEYFPFNKCFYDDCIFNRKGHCCCKRKEMLYNSDRSCARYIRLGEKGIPSVLAEIIEPPLALPLNLLINRNKGNYGMNYTEIHNIQYFEDYIVATFGEKNLRTTIHNNDLIEFLMREREPFAIKDTKTYLRLAEI